MITPEVTFTKVIENTFTEEAELEYLRRAIIDGGSNGSHNNLLAIGYDEDGHIYIGMESYGIMNANQPREMRFPELYRETSKIPTNPSYMDAIKLNCQSIAESLTNLNYRDRPLIDRNLILQFVGENDYIMQADENYVNQITEEPRYPDRGIYETWHVYFFPEMMDPSSLTFDMLKKAFAFKAKVDVLRKYPTEITWVSNNILNLHGISVLSQCIPDGGNTNRSNRVLVGQPKRVTPDKGVTAIKMHTIRVDDIRPEESIYRYRYSYAEPIPSSISVQYNDQSSSNELYSPHYNDVLNLPLTMHHLGRGKRHGVAIDQSMNRVISGHFVYNFNQIDIEIDLTSEEALRKIRSQGYLISLSNLFPHPSFFQHVLLNKQHPIIINLRLKANGPAINTDLRKFLAFSIFDLPIGWGYHVSVGRVIVNIDVTQVNNQYKHPVLITLISPLLSSSEEKERRSTMGSEYYRLYTFEHLKFNVNGNLKFPIYTTGMMTFGNWEREITLGSPIIHSMNGQDMDRYTEYFGEPEETHLGLIQDPTQNRHNWQGLLHLITSYYMRLNQSSTPNNSPDAGIDTKMRDNNNLTVSSLRPMKVAFKLEGYWGYLNE